MSDPAHERLSRLFLEAVKLSPSERRAFLDEACADDPELRRRVEAMVEHDGRPGGPLHTGGLGPAQAAAADPSRIGPYEILEKLGEGGMGVVYRARQRQPIRREVAIKLIRAGYESGSIIERFASERQSLALMGHPNIAGVLDAGTTTDGRPYFVMEYVQGTPITDYCDEHQLGLEQRLELFSQVCEGVQHAHHKAIIHRDLKPSNVLVTEQDGRPVPKIIDFGIAKATDRPRDEATPRTEAGQFFGTPEYMSPEQAVLGGGQVDTRTDVYALGVLFYELLVGRRPFEFGSAPDVGLDQVLRTIREQPPCRPSQRTERARLARRLSGDLDWIALKALEKEPARRYTTPREMAADIERHLSHEPLVAGPPSRTYRMSKFVRKHRVAVGFATVLLLFLVGFGVTMAVLANRIAEEGARANEEAARARQQAQAAMQVQEVLLRMLQLIDSNQASGETWSVPEMLFWARSALERTLRDEPVVRSRVLLMLGQIYHNLGYEQGEQLVQESLQQLEQALIEDASLDVESLRVLAVRDAQLGHLREAELFASRVVEILSRDLGEDDEQTLDAVADLAKVLMLRGRLDEAESLLTEALDDARRTLASRHATTLKLTGHLATVFTSSARPREAEALLVPGLQEMTEALGAEHRLTLTAMYDLSVAMLQLDQPSRALELLREAVDAGFVYMRTVPDGRMVHGRDGILRDPVWAALHGDPTFEATVGARSWGAAIEEAQDRLREGDREGSIRALRTALDRGCRVLRPVASNARLSSLHGDPEFEAIVAEVKARRNP